MFLKEVLVRLFNSVSLKRGTESGALDTQAAGGLTDGLSGSKHGPIRVVHVAETIAGGIASYFEEIAEYQNESFGKGNVSFLIPSGSEMHLPIVDPAQLITFAPASRRPGALRNFGQFATKAIRQLDPDIVHIHSSFAGAIIRAFLPRGPGTPRIIYCPHGWAFAIETAKAKKLAYAVIERRLAPRTDLILVNSESEYNLAVKFGLPVGKLRIVPNGIAWSSLPARAKGTAGIRLAFIGRHDRQKGLDVLLKTIDRFSYPDISFDIVGESVVGTRSHCSSQAANLRFHGWLPRTAIADLLRHVDAVIMPSRWEAFGLVAIEAMRAGVPVIASNRGALPEIVEDGVGGYIFDLDDPDALGLLLGRLDKSELKRIGLSARTRWENQFVSTQMNELTEEAYRYVLSQRPRGGARRGSSAGDATADHRSNVLVGVQNCAA